MQHSNGFLVSCALCFDKKKPAKVALAKSCWGFGEVKEFGEVVKLLEQGERLSGSVSLAPSLARLRPSRLVTWLLVISCLI